MLKTLAVICLILFAFSASQAQQPATDSLTLKRSLYRQPELVTLRVTPSPLVIPQGFCVKKLPFFCDKEYKLEKLTKIPFRFRLGSVEYCDRMENKNR